MSDIEATPWVGIKYSSTRLRAELSTFHLVHNTTQYDEAGWGAAVESSNTQCLYSIFEILKALVHEIASYGWV